MKGGRQTHIQEDWDSGTHTRRQRHRKRETHTRTQTETDTRIDTYIYIFIIYKIPYISVKRGQCARIIEHGLI